MEIFFYFTKIGLVYFHSTRTHLCDITIVNIIIQEVQKTKNTVFLKQVFLSEVLYFLRKINQQLTWSTLAGVEDIQMHVLFSLLCIYLTVGVSDDVFHAHNRV